MHKKGTAVHEHGLLSQWRGYARGVEEKLLAFYGVGPVTLNIFLREMRPFWTKADPAPLPTVKKLAKRLSIDLNRYNWKSLVFARVEAGLIRRRRELAAA